MLKEAGPGGDFTMEQVAGRTCDPMRGPGWRVPFLMVCSQWKKPMLEQIIKNCSRWEGPNLEKFMKDCPLWVEPHAGASEQHE